MVTVYIVGSNSLPGEGGRRSEFRLCVAGSGELTHVLQDLVRGERVLGLPVEVQALGSREAARGRGCQVLFLAGGARTARAMLDAEGGEPVLTVGDRSNGTRGGVIDFVIRDGKVRFVIDRGLARRQGLELSSKLLDIAVGVEP